MTGIEESVKVANSNCEKECEAFEKWWEENIQTWWSEDVEPWFTKESGRK